MREKKDQPGQGDVGDVDRGDGQARREPDQRKF